VAYLVGNRIKNKHIKEFPYYKYFVWGLWAKIFAGLAFAAVYLYYYEGGDTVYYFWGSQSIFNMLGKDVTTFFKLLMGNHSAEVYSMFDYNTGYPIYFRDPNSFSVSRFNLPFYLLGLGSYLGNTVIMNLVLYIGVWQFYKMVVKLYPTNEKDLAIALFFVPSVVFWSSGILKDGWTLTAIMVMFVNFYHIFILKEKVFKNLLWLLVWSYIAFSIRPYIFYVALGSGLIWVGFSAIKSIQSAFLRTIAFPFIIILVWVAGATIIAQTGTVAGQRYSSVDAMLETAQIIQDDLRKDYYGGNSFDIGAFEPTFAGVLSKAPLAIVAGTFRPFIWEGNGALMLLAGLENLALLVLVFYLLIKMRIFRFFTSLGKDPFLLALFVLAITFAFTVGLTTANFGALVRYNIPVKVSLVLVLFELNRQVNKIKTFSHESSKTGQVYTNLH
jgi:hypothetical protein